MNPLVISILNNPSAHQVNRAEKMNQTLDVMSDNKANQIAQKQVFLEQSAGDIKLTGEHYGYANNRWQGD
jgi:hypothetical protein